MTQPKTQAVISEDGARGVIVDEQPDEANTSNVLVQFEAGQHMIVPAEVLLKQADGNYYLPMRVNDLAKPRDQKIALAAGESLALPVVAEALDVQKRTVETGRVRVRKVVHEEAEVVDEPLLREEVQVKRVAVNRMVEGTVRVRQEGDTLIIPIFEEVLVVEKRLMLREELHVIKRETTTHQPQQFTLRREDVTVERVASDEHGQEADAA